MAEIKIHDKTFAPFIDHATIQDSVKVLGEKLMVDYQDKTPLFIGVLNGAFMFSADLMKVYKGNADIGFIRLSSYYGTASTGQVKSILGLDMEVEGRHIIILEDIIDTGFTIEFLTRELNKKNPESIRVATLLLKPMALRANIRPDYVGIEIPNDFIVGYGLDYNGLGRNLTDIYKIVE
jgi:hypoxanthine phosphoribosyltransferase